MLQIFICSQPLLYHMKQILPQVTPFYFAPQRFGFVDQVMMLREDKISCDCTIYNTWNYSNRPSRYCKHSHNTYYRIDSFNHPCLRTTATAAIRSVSFHLDQNLIILFVVVAPTPQSPSSNGRRSRLNRKEWLPFYISLGSRERKKTHRPTPRSRRETLSKPP